MADAETGDLDEESTREFLTILSAPASRFTRCYVRETERDLDAHLVLDRPIGISFEAAGAWSSWQRAPRRSSDMCDGIMRSTKGRLWRGHVMSRALDDAAGLQGVSIGILVGNDVCYGVILYTERD